MAKGKSTTGLMAHMRERHNIKISGNSSRRDLLNMGYYHGYKAYRFVRGKENRLEITEFSQIKAVYDFDLGLKTLFFPTLIRMETALKNRVLDYIVSDNSVEIEVIYNDKLNDFSAKKPGTGKYKEKVKKKLNFRAKMDGTIAYYYGNGNPSIQHFFHNNKPVPIWAYFEVITLGEFGNFINCLTCDDRIGILRDIGINHSGLNQNGRILENIVFAINALRNATMHNSVIFDCRFNNQNYSKQIKTYLEAQTGISGITFESAIDFFILLIYLEKNIGISRVELRKTAKAFNKLKEKLYKNIPGKSYFEILGSDIRKKTLDLENYIELY